MVKPSHITYKSHRMWA